VRWNHGLKAIARKPDAIYPHRWSSAHEAATNIARLILKLLVEPLSEITNVSKQRAEAKRLLAARWKAFEMPRDEIADLEERIRRERAKLLVTTQKESKTAKPERRLTVDFSSKTLTFDGMKYPVSSERALRWVKILADRSPAWVSSSELEKIDRDL